MSPPTTSDPDLRLSRVAPALLGSQHRIRICTPSAPRRDCIRHSRSPQHRQSNAEVGDGIWRRDAEQEGLQEPRHEERHFQPKEEAGRRQALCVHRDCDEADDPVYSPTVGNSSAAVVVYPGGGFNVLAMDIDGMECANGCDARRVLCAAEVMGRMANGSSAAAPVTVKPFARYVHGIRNSRSFPNAPLN